MTASWTRVVLHGFLLCFLAAATATAADRTRAAAAAPLRTARSAEWLGGPVVGFLASGSPVGIRAVLGVPGAAVAGEPLALPEDVARVHLAPGHQYAILDFAGAAPPSILNLEAGGEPAGVAKAMLWIDQVEFSPTGRSAALYSAAEQRLQIWTGLPREPRLVSELAAPEAVRLAVSDDGRWLLAASPSGVVDLISAEGGDVPVFRASGPPVLEFLPNRLEAVVCDSERGEIHLLGGFGGAVSTRLLAADLAGVDVVAPSSDGRSVVALASEPGRGWRIEVESGAARPFDLPVRPEFLEAMRVPDSYLISSRAGEPAWLLIPGEAETRAYFVPAVAKPGSGASQ